MWQATAKDSGGNDAAKLADRSGRRRSREIIDNAAAGDGPAAAKPAMGRRRSRDSKEMYSAEMLKADAPAAE